MHFLDKVKNAKEELSETIIDELLNVGHLDHSRLELQQLPDEIIIHHLNKTISNVETASILTGDHHEKLDELVRLRSIWLYIEDLESKYQKISAVC